MRLCANPRRCRRSIATERRRRAQPRGTNGPRRGFVTQAPLGQAFTRRSPHPRSCGRPRPRAPLPAVFVPDILDGSGVSGATVLSMITMKFALLLLLTGFPVEVRADSLAGPLRRPL